MGVHLLLRGKQAEGLAAVQCRDPNVIWEVVLGVHHLQTLVMLTIRGFSVRGRGGRGEDSGKVLNNKMRSAYTKNIKAT